MTEPSRGASGGCAGGSPVCPAVLLPRERPQHRPGTPVTVTFLLSAVAEGMGGLRAFPYSTALSCPAVCLRVVSGRSGLICLSFRVWVRTFPLLGRLALDMLRVLLRCAHCWGAQSCDGHKQRPQNPGQPQAPLLPAGKAVAARPGEVPCSCLGTACLGQVLSAWLAQEPGRASWLPALFANPILFPFSGSRQGRRRAGGRRAGSLLSPGPGWPLRASEGRREAAISKRLCVSTSEGWRQRWGCSCAPPLSTSQGWGSPARGIPNTG